MGKPSPVSSNHTRRGILKRGTAALGSAFVAMSSGCLETLPPLGRRVRFGRVDAPEPGEPDYRRWIPASSELPEGHGKGGSMMYTTPGEVGDEMVGVPVRFPGNFIVSDIDYFGQEYESYDVAFRFGYSTVLLGDIDTESVADTLADTRYESVGSYEGYDLFERNDLTRTVGVSESALVFSKGDDSEDAVRAVLDASEGRVLRRHEEDEAFGVLTELVGSTPFSIFGASGGLVPGNPTRRSTTVPAEPSYRATSFRYDGDGVYHTRYFVYPEGELPPEVDVRDAAEEHASALDLKSVEVEIDERTVKVEMHEPHTKFARRQRTEERIPLVTWGIEYDAEAGEVTLTHEGGESIDAEALRVTYDQPLEVPSSRTPQDADTQFADVYDEVTQGDGITVNVGEVEEDDKLILSYISDNTHSPMEVYELGAQGAE